MGSNRTTSETLHFIFRLDELLLLVVLPVILFSLAVSTLQELKETEMGRGERARVLSPDGKLISVISEAGNAVFGVEDADLRFTLPEDSGALAFSPDNRVLAVRLPGGVAILDSRTGKEDAVLGGRYQSGPLRFSPDGSLIVFQAPLDNEVHIWDLASRTLLQTFASELDRVQVLDFLADGAVVIGGSSYPNFEGDPDGVITIRDIRTGERWSGFVEGKSVRHLAVSSDGSRIASSAGGFVRILDPMKGTVIAKISTSTRDILKLSSDGRLLVTADWNAAEVHRVEDGQLIATLRGHSGILCDAVFVDDDQKLVTAGEYAAVCTWDVASGRLLRRRRGLTLRADPIPWAMVVIFASWLGVWIVLGLTRSRKAHQAGERPDSGLWILGLLATLFVANCLIWISLYPATGSTDRLRIAGISLGFTALIMGLVPMVETLGGLAPHPTRRIVLCVLNLILAAAVVVPNVLLLSPHGV